MLKRLHLVISAMGSVWWGWLIVLIIVIVGAIAAMKLLPRASAPESSRVVARGKISSTPAPKSASQAEVPQTPAAVRTEPVPLKHDDAPSSASDVQSSRTPMPSESDDFPDTSQTRLTQASGKPDAHRSIVSGDETPSLKPAVVPGNAPVDPGPIAQVPIEDVPVEKSDSAYKAEMQAAKAAAANAPDNIPPSGQKIDTTEDRAAVHNGPVQIPEAQDLAKDDGKPEVDSEKKASFAIQVGAYRNRMFAENMTSKLKGLGYPAFIFELKKRDKRPLYMVRFGRFGSRDAATRSAADFKEKEKMPALVVISKSR